MTNPSADCVSFGINPLGWTNDDLPSLGAYTPLEQCLREAKAAGFSGVELGNKFPRTTRALREVLAPHALSLVSGWYSSQLVERSVEEEIDSVSAHLALLKDLNAPVMVVGEVSGCIHGDITQGISRRPVLSEKQWPEFAKKMSEFSIYLKEQGVELAFHYHMGTVIETQDEILRFIDVTHEAVGILLDTGHLTFAGGDVDGIIRAAGKRINHVHCKDIRPEVLKDVRNRDCSFLNAVLEGVFTIPGDGCVDFQSVFKSLALLGYAGWLVQEAEQDPSVAPSFAAAKNGFNFLFEQAQQAGLIQ